MVQTVLVEGAAPTKTHYVPSKLPRVYLDEEAGEEEQHAENNDAERAGKHGILEGFHDLTCARGGRGCVWHSRSLVVHVGTKRDAVFTYVL